MQAYFNLVTPDGYITSIDGRSADVTIENIDPSFVGFSIDPSRIHFNLKSLLAQLGLDATLEKLTLNKNSALLKITFQTHGPLAEEMLELLEIGAAVGKLFACDERRLVRDPFYLERMFGRKDHAGLPLLSFGGGKIPMEKVGGRTIAHIPLLPGQVHYHPTISGLLPTIAKALKNPSLSLRSLLALHQYSTAEKQTPSNNNILLVKTEPLHIRTVFARVAEDLLPKGLHHTSAAILDPSTSASGDIYELFGEGSLTSIPLEFYTLQPEREHVFFSDRDQLKNSLQEDSLLFKTFENSPSPKEAKAALFICKGTQLAELKKSDWVVCEGTKSSFPGFMRPSEQTALIEEYIQKEPSYPFLSAIESGSITSEGVLFCRYLPSPLMKRMLLSSSVYKCLKRIYFESPSRDQHGFFTHEDRAMLLDLAKFGIPVYWVDKITKSVLRYVPRVDCETGMFVPQDKVQTFLEATLFGVYGSNLLEGTFEVELQKLMQGALTLVKDPLALVTGGGPGAMEIGNKIAKNLGILSCANIVDFGVKGVVNEQKQNPHVEAKMTYSLDHLVERQAEFNLDFPIFLPGGIGTDFEYALEEVRRKVGSHQCSPVLLFGGKEHWASKITPRFQANLKSGTIKGSEWVSNCFYAIDSAEEGIEIWRRFFEGTLPIGKEGPVFEAGFATLPVK